MTIPPTTLRDSCLEQEVAALRATLNPGLPSKPAADAPSTPPVKEQDDEPKPV